MGVKRFIPFMKEYPIHVFMRGVRSTGFFPMYDRARKVTTKEGDEYYLLKKGKRMLAPQSFDDIAYFPGFGHVLELAVGSRAYAAINPRHPLGEKAEQHIDPRDPSQALDASDAKMLNSENLDGLQNFIVEDEELSYNIHWILNRIEKAKNKYRESNFWKDNAPFIITIISVIASAVLMYITGSQVIEASGNFVPLLALLKGVRHD